MVRLIPLLPVLSIVTAPCTGQERIDFLTQVAPIFQSRCVECHGPTDAQVDLRFDMEESLFRDRPEDQVVIRGNARDSRLVQRITLPADDPELMPADGIPLTDEQIAILIAWIDQGAVWPENGDAYFFEKNARTGLAFQVPELTEAQETAQAEALAMLHEADIVAGPVALNTKATNVNFSLLRERVGDDQLALLHGLEPTLAWLNLSHTRITDEGLAQLEAMTQLRRLHLAQTGITDAGLQHLAGLHHLDYLNLYGTKITDVGLQHLRSLANLQKLFLFQTEVTDEGVATLQEALPELVVNRGW